MYLTKAGVVNETGHAYSIWSIYCHFPYGYFTSVRFIIWEVLLANARGQRRCVWGTGASRFRRALGHPLVSSGWVTISTSFQFGRSRLFMTVGTGVGAIPPPPYFVTKKSFNITIYKWVYTNKAKIGSYIAQWILEITDILMYNVYPFEM